MRFINEYKNRGGKVGVGEDAGYIYSTYGFGYIEELEMLREAGFSPLEVINAATLQGAKILGVEKETGSIQVGKRADLVIVKENPLANLKVLYASGHIKLDPVTNKPVQVGGIDFVIKNGTVYDGAKLRDEITSMVAAKKQELGVAPGAMPVVGFELSKD
jgi:imidazolonepropionase-like amidohydrolase